MASRICFGPTCWCVMCVYVIPCMSPCLDRMLSAYSRRAYDFWYVLILFRNALFAYALARARTFLNTLFSVARADHHRSKARRGVGKWFQLQRCRVFKAASFFCISSFLVPGPIGCSWKHTPWALRCAYVLHICYYIKHTFVCRNYCNPNVVIWWWWWFGYYIYVRSILTIVAIIWVFHIDKHAPKSNLPRAVMVIMKTNT